MDSCQYLHTPPITCLISTSRNNKSIPQNLFFYKTQTSSSSSAIQALKSPQGFGSGSSSKIKKKKNEEKEEKTSSIRREKNNEDEEGVIPEIVTNRMLKRVGLSVGVPLSVGLSFFPFFYYLKVGLKIDVPTWVPFIVSFVFFGSALLGVTYGIVSSSWDPMREGSLLGWNEAKRNWPVFWQSLSRGGGGPGASSRRD